MMPITTSHVAANRVCEIRSYEVYKEKWHPHMNSILATHTR